MALTSTISNTVKDPNGNALVGVPVTVTLMPTGGFRVDDATEVARMVSTTTNGSGVWSLALERNSNITPASTYYLVVEQIPAAAGGPRTWNIQVGASNQTVSAALVTPLPAAQASGFLTQASADARYQALGSLGSGTPATVDPGDAGTAGVSASASRADHQHPVTITSSQLVPAAAIAAWASWTPTLTNLTLGNGTVIAKFVQLGKTVHWRFKFTLGSTSAVGTLPQFTLPVPAHADYSAVDQPLGISNLIDLGNAGYGALVVATASGAAIFVRVGGSGASNVGVTATAPFTWGTGDQLVASGTYEAA